MTVKIANPKPGGSPAWAGIDLSKGMPAILLARFPRVGGDRPSQAHFSRSLDGVPPRGRG